MYDVMIELVLEEHHITQKQSASIGYYVSVEGLQRRGRRSRITEATWERIGQTEGCCLQDTDNQNLR